MDANQEDEIHAIPVRAVEKLLSVAVVAVVISKQSHWSKKKTYTTQVPASRGPCTTRALYVISSSRERSFHWKRSGADFHYTARERIRHGTAA